MTHALIVIVAAVTFVSCAPSDATRVPHSAESTLDSSPVDLNPTTSPLLDTGSIETSDVMATDTSIVSTASVEEPDAATLSHIDTGKPFDPAAPATKGEVCRQLSRIPSGVSFTRPCARGLVCCNPPHGAAMPIDYWYCAAPCKNTARTAGASSGCSGGCPWANVP